MGTDEKCKSISPFLRAFLIRDSQRATFYLFEKSVLFLRDILQVCGTAAAVNEHNSKIVLAAIWHNMLQLRDGLLVQSFFAERRAVFWKQSYVIVEPFRTQASATKRPARLKSTAVISSTTLKKLKRFFIYAP